MASENTEQLSPLPAGTPLADLLLHLRDKQRGMDFRESLPDLLALLGLDFTDWNAQKNPLKVVRTYADLLALNPLSCCRGTRGVVLDDSTGYPAGDYLLLYTDHAQAWNYVCQDGTFDQNPNNLTDAAWYPIDSPEAGVPAYGSFTPAYSAGPPIAGYSFTQDQLVRFFVPGNPTEQFGARRNDGPAATATAALLDVSGSPDGADPNWRLVNRQDVLNAIYQFTAQEAINIRSLVAPITQRDFDGTFTGEGDILQAAQWLSDDRALLFNAPRFQIPADATFGSGFIRGNGVILALDGNTITMDSTTVADVSADSGALAVLGTVLWIGGQSFPGTLDLTGAAQLTLRDVPAGAIDIIAGPTTGQPTRLVLQNSTKFPVAPTITGLVTIVDERGGTGGPVRDIYAITDAKKAQVIALFGSGTDFSHADVLLSGDAHGSYIGTRFPDKANNDFYECAPDTTVPNTAITLPDGSHPATETWFRY